MYPIIFPMILVVSNNLNIIDTMAKNEPKNIFRNLIEFPAYPSL